MTIIDSDAHVVETPETWSYMTGEDEVFHPEIFTRSESDNAPRGDNRRKEFWVIDDHLIAKGANQGNDVPADSRDMVSVKSRLDHMDELGADIAVLFPTMWLRPMTKEFDVEYALVRSYNRWLADIWKQSNNRLRWAVIPPLLSLIDKPKVRDELVFAKEHGAVSIFMRGMESDRLLSHRYFFPLYEMAQELDLADDAMAANRLYVTTQVTDDIPSIVGAVGDDNLLIGTDYGHSDTATDIDAMKRLGAEGGIPQVSVDKILQANPARRYGLR